MLLLGIARSPHIAQAIDHCSLLGPSCGTILGHLVQHVQGLDR